jgi:murein DD-endopeptidase MepM/ murein hydrolase activator NlpD
MHSIAISLRLVLQSLFLIPVFWVLVERPAFTENHLRVQSFPKLVRQGNVCLISASGSSSLKTIYLEFKRERYPMAFNGKNGTYEGLLGIDMNIRPSTYEIKVVATDGDNNLYSRAHSLKVEKVNFGIQKLSLPSSMVDLDAKTLERVNKESKMLKGLLQAFRNERLWSGPFIRPVEGEISGEFGLNRIINGQSRSPHTGVDLRAEEGTPVLACNSGVVIFVGQLFFSGKSVVLDHGWGLYSMYFHLSEALVKKGEKVHTGTLLGRVGSTGRSTEPHLHWAIRINGARVDPLALLNIGVSPLGS